MNWEIIITLIAEVATLVGVLAPVIADNRKSKKGQLCLLRSEMLRSYYDNREKQTIRQYEYENFVFLYEAYKARKGNSFIDKIYDEVRSWEIIT